MKIVEVNNSKERKAFLKFPHNIYKDDKEWVAPLHQDVEKIFDADNNKWLKRGGKAIRWNLYENRKAIGRIAAFVHPKYEGNQPVGGIGFFECINNQEAANSLFDTAKGWLLKQGMQTMDGPINFGERDQFWGLLVKGFYQPLYAMNYNPPYYVQLFENYGFRLYFNQECFALPVNKPLSEKIIQTHSKISQDSQIHSEHLNKKNLDKYIYDFHTIYNEAWATHGGGKEMSLAQAKKIFHTMKPVIDEKIVWFVYHEHRPIAFWLNLPDLNHYFKPMKGKFGLWQKIQFLFYKTFRKSKRIVGIAFGVVPDFQGKGIDKYMIVEGRKTMEALGYKDYEMQWIGDFNPKMINVANGLEATISRRLRTYRYHFDPNKKIERHKIV